MKPPTGSSWYVIGSSVRGAYHIDIGAPNEDAFLSYQSSEDFQPVIIAVADGVGDDKCYRSATGSKLAVKAAIESSKDFFQRSNQQSSDEIRGLLITDIIDKWTVLIQEDIKINPFNEEERERNDKYISNIISDDPGNSSTVYDNLRWLFPYSTTLLFAMITNTHVFFFQIGDGDIVIVDGKGKVVHLFPEIVRCGRVIPLSYPDVLNDSHVAVFPLEELDPLLILISTDGYSDGYEYDFPDHIAYEFFSHFQEYNPDYIRESLPSILSEISILGSRDDVSLGIIAGSLERIKKTRLQFINPQLFTIDSGEDVPNSDTEELLQVVTETTPEETFMIQNRKEEPEGGNSSEHNRPIETDI